MTRIFGSIFLGLVVSIYGYLLLCFLASIVGFIREKVKHWMLTRKLTQAEARLAEKPRTPDRMWIITEILPTEGDKNIRLEILTPLDSDIKDILSQIENQS